jgi:transposase
MYRHQISQVKLNRIRKKFIEGTYSTYWIARELNISTKTSWHYFNELKRIKAEEPGRLADMNFYIADGRKPHSRTPLYEKFLERMPLLMATEKPGVKAKPVWRKYREIELPCYNYCTFKDLFYLWLKEHPLLKTPPLLSNISEEDRKVLAKWRHSNIHRNWQIAVALELALTGANATQIMAKADVGRKALTKWLNAYRAKGLKGFDFPLRILNCQVVKRQNDRKDNIIKLLHETPKLHGLNRTSWTITALTAIYNQIYPETVSYMQVSYCLNQMGCSYKKSRDILTSQDFKYREKIENIQQILQHLKPNEKFFSVDEYGPVGVKIKGGRMLKAQDDTPLLIPAKQRNKGVVICTAALELSTNQVTHFYSLTKDTFEMIKLIDLLLTRYHDQETLYISWDAVSWHRSIILMNHIKDHNIAGKPKIRLAPLPSCTQFLNVIESVFAGLAKAVIHNSNYMSLDACKEAIDLHFQTRNRHFIENPKRAGKKIWGKETVAPQFIETNNCMNRTAMKGSG